MTFLSRALTALGALLLAHAAYSAHEHSSLSPPTTPPLLNLNPSSLLPSTSPLFPPATTPAPPTTSLPLDIILETLFSVLILCLGIVLSSGAEGLKPVLWSVWGGGVERGGGGHGTATTAGGMAAGKGKGMGKAVGVEGGNPFRAFEERRGFLDVRAQRREFAEWVREGGGAGVGK